MSDVAGSPAVAATPTRVEILKEAIARVVPGLGLVANHTGELTYDVPAERLLEVATALRDGSELKFEMCMDVCGVDYLDHGRDEWKRRASAAASPAAGGARRSWWTPQPLIPDSPWSTIYCRSRSIIACGCACSARTRRSPWWIR